MNIPVAPLIVLAALVVLAATAIVLVFFARGQGKNVKRTLKLEVRNDGNVPGRYQLKADDPTGSLRFQWVLNGSPLGARQEPVVASAPQLPSPAAPARPAGQSEVTKSAGGLKNASGTISDVLMGIGNLLPGSIGLPLINLGSQLREGQYTAERVSNMPGQVARMNPLGDKGQVYAAGSSQATYVPSKPATANAGPSGAVVAAADIWAQTPPVPPGGALTLDLVIQPMRAQHFQQYAFKVLSKSVEQPEMLVAENGSVSIAGVSTLQRLLPVFIFVAVALVTLACSTFLLANPRILGG